MVMSPRKPGPEPQIWEILTVKVSPEQKKYLNDRACSQRITMSHIVRDMIGATMASEIQLISEK